MQPTNRWSGLTGCSTCSIARVLLVDEINPMWKPAILVFCLIFLTGCVSCPPDWFLEKPVEDGYRYGAGKCDPTYIETKAREIALTSALQDLGRQKRVYLTSRSEMISTESGTAGSAHGTIAESEVDIEGFEIVEEHMCDGSWYHNCIKGTTYVLVRISEKRLLGY